MLQWSHLVEAPRMRQSVSPHKRIILRRLGGHVWCVSGSVSCTSSRRQAQGDEG